MLGDERDTGRSLDRTPSAITSRQSEWISPERYTFHTLRPSLPPIDEERDLVTTWRPRCEREGALACPEAVARSSDLAAIFIVSIAGVLCRVEDRGASRPY